MAEYGATAGVVTSAEINAGPSASGKGFVDVNSPAFWSTVWAIAALCWLLYVFGRGR